MAKITLELSIEESAALLTAVDERLIKLQHDGEMPKPTNSLWEILRTQKIATHMTLLHKVRVQHNALLKEIEQCGN